MSGDRQHSIQATTAAPRAVRILALGTAGDIPLAVKMLTSSGAPTASEADEGLSFTEIARPDEDRVSLLRAGSQADVAMVGFEPGATALAKLQRWVWLASELSVPHLVVTVESAGLPLQERANFDAVMSPIMDFVKDRCEFQSVIAVPINAATSGNIVDRDPALAWYDGPALHAHLGGCVNGAAGKKSGQIDDDPAAQPIQSDHFQARLFWLQDDPLLPWRWFQLCAEHDKSDATITSVKYELDPHAVTRIARHRLHSGDMGVCDINTTVPVTCVPFAHDRQAGLFTLIDPETQSVAALGLIDYSLRRASNIKWQETTITPAERAGAKHQKASVLWFTGLSGAGKSTIADRVEKRLTAEGRHTMLLDGDNVRHGLNKDLGFTDVDRVENIRRISEVSKLMCDAGLIVLVSFISPFRAERQLARETVESHDFHEIYIATSLDVAEKRDVKGLYAKARAGEIKNFTGIDSPYEPPLDPQLIVDTTSETPDQAAERIISELLKV